jgi:hypothetical protein
MYYALYALHHSYSGVVGAAKIVHYKLAFTMNKLNLTIN